MCVYERFRSVVALSAHQRDAEKLRNAGSICAERGVARISVFAFID